MREKKVVLDFSNKVRSPRHHTEVIDYVFKNQHLLKGMPIYVRYRINYGNGERPVVIGRIAAIMQKTLLVTNNPFPDLRAILFHMTPARKTQIDWQCMKLEDGANPDIAELLMSEDTIYELFYYKDEMNNSVCKSALIKELEE